MKIIVVLLSIFLFGMPGQAAEPDGPHSPEHLSAYPVIIPPDFCIMYADPHAMCTAAVSFTVLPDGTVADAKVVRSSKVRDCDRAVIDSVKSRKYSPSSGFKLAVQPISSQTCSATRGR